MWTEVFSSFWKIARSTIAGSVPFSLTGVGMVGGRGVVWALMERKGLAASKLPGPQRPGLGAPGGLCPRPQALAPFPADAQSPLAGALRGPHPGSGPCPHCIRVMRGVCQSSWGLLRSRGPQSRRVPTSPGTSGPRPPRKPRALSTHTARTTRGALWSSEEVLGGSGLSVRGAPVQVVSLTRASRGCPLGGPSVSS